MTDGIVRQNGSEMRFDGLFSLGYPARRTAARRSTRAFASFGGMSTRFATRSGSTSTRSPGLLSGEFHLTGEYLRPVGFGGMTLDNFVAYGEPFQKATASLRFDGTGVRLDDVAVEKAGGAITGAAFIGWDSTYSFNFDGRRIPVEKIARLGLRSCAADRHRRVLRKGQRHVRSAAKRLPVPRQRSVHW